jgi:hypothetical protein
MSQVHVEVAVGASRAASASRSSCTSRACPYVETIKGEARAQGRYKKQTGGRGQFGDCVIVIEPLEGHVGYEFVDKIVGGVIPQGFRPAVDKGIQEAMAHGELAGAPIQGVRVRLVDGSYHTVDSSEMAFKVAGSMAFKSAYEKAQPVLLEPIMQLEVTVPDDAVGGGQRRPQLAPRPPAGHGAEGRHDDDPRRGSDGGGAHVLAVADVDDRRSRRLPHGIPQIRRGTGAHRSEVDRSGEEREGGRSGLGAGVFLLLTSDP